MADPILRVEDVWLRRDGRDILHGVTGDAALASNTPLVGVRHD